MVVHKYFLPNFFRTFLNCSILLQKETVKVFTQFALLFHGLFYRLEHLARSFFLSLFEFSIPEESFFVHIIAKNGNTIRYLK